MTTTSKSMRKRTAIQRAAVKALAMVPKVVALPTFLPDATDFTDIAVQPDPAIKYPDKVGYVLCPKCHGHGRWNLTLNAYAAAPGDPSGKRQHFQGSCGQCWGWGWVTGADATCVHDYVEVAPDAPFRCYHTVQCKVCGEKKSYSSDD